MKVLHILGVLERGNASWVRLIWTKDAGWAGLCTKSFLRVMVRGGDSMRRRQAPLLCAWGKVLLSVSRTEAIGAFEDGGDDKEAFYLPKRRKCGDEVVTCISR